MRVRKLEVKRAMTLMGPLECLVKKSAPQCHSSDGALVQVLALA